MSRKTHQRSMLQVLGLYAAGSWIILQVIDVLSQNLGVPPWVFTLTLALLIIGLPITAATAYFQGIGGKPSADKETAGASLSAFTWGNVLKGGVAALALWGIAVTGWVVMGDRQMVDSERDLVTGMDEIRRLVGERDYPAANAIARELDSVILNDSVREAMWAEVSRKLTLQTDPPGALAFRRNYRSADTEWEELGRTPVEVQHFPLGLSRVRFELEGYFPRETADSSGRLAAAPPFRLDTEETLPRGMARVSGGSARSWLPVSSKLRR
jgi:hypothetical protein